MAISIKSLAPGSNRVPVELMGETLVFHVRLATHSELLDLNRKVQSLRSELQNSSVDAVTFAKVADHLARFVTQVDGLEESWGALCADDKIRVFDHIPPSSFWDLFAATQDKLEAEEKKSEGVPAEGLP